MGAGLDALPVRREILASLPVYLSNSYELHEIEVCNHRVVMAISKSTGKPELAQLAKDRELLSEKLGREVVLALPQLKSYERRRLIQKHVPFIVPGRQMFMPMLSVDLREFYPTPMAAPKKNLSWVAQVMLLRHLLCCDIVEHPLAAIADALGYSAMAITQGLDELVVLGLCQRKVEGRVRTIRFEHAPGILWLEALPFLRSPVKKRYFVHELNRQKLRSFRSGATALSDATNLSPSPKPIVAMDAKEVRRAVNAGQIEIGPFEEDAAVILEAWAYSPERLSNGLAVDPLSLYLSLKDEPDERVQMALDQLMEAWR
jgi:hypothetical protein